MLGTHNVGISERRPVIACWQIEDLFTFRSYIHKLSDTIT